MSPAAVRLRQAHGLLAQGAGEAARAIFAALRTDSDWAADACNGLGLCAEAAGDAIAAEAQYRQALSLREEPEYLNNLAICLQQQGRAAEALEAFARLAALLPEPQILYNLALAQLQANSPWEALASLVQVLRMQPQLREPAELLLGLIYRLGGDDAVRERLQALAQSAEAAALAGWQLALGAWHSFQGQPGPARRQLEAALSAEPRLVGAYRPLIQVLLGSEDFAACRARLNAFFERDDSETLLLRIMSMQEPIPASEAVQLGLHRELLALLERAMRLELPSGREPFRPRKIPYYHVYQTGWDLELQQPLANCFARWVAPATTSSRPAARPRLGIVSGYLYSHSVMHFLLRALETLLACGDFESHVFYTPSDSSRQDACTARLRALADRFHAMPLLIEQGAQVIAAQGLDLLIYLDLGMDPYSYVLGLQRLARHQLVLPGHPVTTGMGTIDYFVSGADLDPPGAEAHYSEQLLRLPGLPDYERPELPPEASREQLGLPSGRLYFCPMTLFKLTPAFDEVMAGILAADPEAKVLLLKFEGGLWQSLRDRFAARWPELAARLCFLPWSDRQTFYQRLRAVDVLLDSFPFGGGNTAYQAFGLGCPIICLDQPWNKGRWTQALYRQMGLTDLIAATPADYIALAVGLARDPERQARLRTELLARNGVLFDNPTWSQALLEFCRQRVRQP